MVVTILSSTSVTSSPQGSGSGVGRGGHGEYLPGYRAGGDAKTGQWHRIVRHNLENISTTSRRRFTGGGA